MKVGRGRQEFECKGRGNMTELFVRLVRGGRRR